MIEKKELKSLVTRQIVNYYVFYSKQVISSGLGNLDSSVWEFEYQFIKCKFTDESWRIGKFYC